MLLYDDWTIEDLLHCVRRKLWSVARIVGNCTVCFSLTVNIDVPEDLENDMPENLGDEGIAEGVDRWVMKE